MLDNAAEWEKVECKQEKHKLVIPYSFTIFAILIILSGETPALGRHRDYRTN